LDKIKKLDLSWHSAWLPNVQSYYCTATKYLGTFNGKPKYKILYLHDIIMNANEGDYVDHIHHDTLDNRKENLRITINKENTKHRKGKNTNNKSGYRNVCWVNKEQKWIVQLQINGKNTVLGRFKENELDIAGQFAEEMRQKYYGEFKGLS
jgi:hypothetical protein